MKINEEKSKIMIFNFTKNYQFSTRLSIQGEPLETVKETKLLGTILTNDLKWQKNTALIVKRANGRMQLLQAISNFGATWDDLKQIYILFVRSLLEQSCTVWHIGLTEENSTDLERIQKSALKLILKSSYQTYQNALKILDLQTLKNRRENLCLQFAKNA